MLSRVSRVDADMEGFAALYTSACPGLVGYLTVLGGSRADAEDLAQEAFVRLLERWPRIAEYDDPRAWLRQVATRMLISRARRRTVARRALRRLAGAGTTEAPSADRLDLSAALATLPIGSRAVVLLHHVYDLPVDEVADLLRIPVGTVKSRLFRARAALAPLVSEGTLS
jgi:RNA polymerase sigma-70 factor (ECF subfamily)